MSDRRLCPCGAGKFIAYCTRRIGSVLVRYRKCETCHRRDKLALDLSFLHKQKIPEVGTELPQKTA